MKIQHILYTLLIATALTGCGNDSKVNQESKTQNIKVTTQKVQSGTSSRGLVVNGMVQASSQAKLSTRMMGFVERIPAKVGDKVRKGQLLVDIGNSDLSAKRAQATAGIAAAQAQFENARNDLERFTNLFNSNSASQKELEDITTRYNMAKAQLETATQMKAEVDAQFAYVNIRAPFNGVVTNIFTEVGNMANPGVPLIALESPDGFEVEAAIPEAAISGLNKESAVKVYLKTIGKSIDGEIVELSSSGANTSGQYMVTVRLNELPKEVKAGMYAQLEFESGDSTSEAGGSLLVPREAIVQQGQLSGIYTVSSQNTALLRWLRLGRSFGDQVEVLSGLEPGEVFILSAESKLYNGAPVAIQ
jgi:RND family efflux transporter MFP subunit